MTIARIALLFCALILANLLSGCASTEPTIAYSGGDASLANTAVLIATTRVDGPSAALGSIEAVNGQSVPRSSPFRHAEWVRVRAGRNVFTIRHAYNLDIVAGTISVNRVVGDLTIENMLPRHVYVVRYEYVGNGVRFVVEDRGDSGGIRRCDAAGNCHVDVPKFD